MSTTIPTKQESTPGLLRQACSSSSRVLRNGATTSVAGILLLGCFAGGLPAQQLQPPQSALEALAQSTAPTSQAPEQSPVQAVPGTPAVQPESPASISGTVRDSSGGWLTGVRVTLQGQANSFSREAFTSGNGAFVFTNVPPGTYLVKINVQDREPFESAPLIAAPGEKRDLPPIELHISMKRTTVNVTASVEQVADTQVKQEEKQRILGVLPNYYTSYIWNAASLTPKLKFKLAVRTATDPITFLVTGGIAGAEQYHKTFPGYGLGFEGYAKRYGATYADTVSGRILGSAVFPVLFHQDPRYFYRGSGSTRSRIWYALTATMVCRGDDGRLEPNYSHVLGAFAAAGIGNLYHTPQDRTASLTVRNGFVIIGGSAVINLMREFLSRQLTTNLPTSANGKP